MRILISTLAFSICLSVVASPTPAQTAAPVENLRAFATLYGHVRYFHPSDEAAAVDWEAFAIHGVERVRGAAGPGELLQALEELFLPVAPTLRFGWLAKAPPPPAPELSPDTSGLRVVAWQHEGVGFGRANSPYRSVRTNREAVLARGQQNGVLLQVVDPTELRGKEIRLTGIGRVLSPGARAQLWLRVDRPEGMGFFDNMLDRPVRAGTWTEMEIRGTVDADAEAVVLGVLAIGGGTAIDDVRLEVRDESGWRPVTLQNGDFEDPGEDSPPGWQATTRGWDFRAEAGGTPAGDRYLVASPGTITLTGPLFEGHAHPGDIATVPLARGIAAYVPLALWSRAGKTLGAPSYAAREALRVALDSTRARASSPADAAVRLAGIVIAWNVFEHFYPYWDVVDTDPDALLTGALERALADRDGTDFLETLRWMVAGLEDGHGQVTGPGGRAMAGVPFAVRWIEDRVVVVASDTTAFRPGDVIRSVDGRSADAMVAEEIARHSGTLRWRRWKAMTRFGHGEPGTEAMIGLEREDEVHNVTVTRQVREPVPEPRPEPIAELRPGVFYVDLTRADLPAINARIDTLAAADGVVFDLRGYPNSNHAVLTHLTDTPIRSAYWRIPQITRPDWRDEPMYRESRWNLAPQPPRFQGAVVFLTDGRAISYAESVMGIVEHYGLGEIVGQPTAGANGNVNPFTLPGGYSVRWTGMRVVKHDGSQHHLVGIRPTVAVDPTIEGARAGRDEVLERALEILTRR